jgi:hypothetical protein
MCAAVYRAHERLRTLRCIGRLVAIIEDDVRPDIFWAKRLAEFVREQPVHTWDLAKLHGGGPPYAHAPFAALCACYAMRNADGIPV